MIDYSPSERAQLVADLTAARDELAVRGRGKGRMYNPATGEVCMLGAIGVAVVPGFTKMSAFMQHHLCSTDERVVRARTALKSHIPNLIEDARGVDYLWSDNVATDREVHTVYSKALAEIKGLA